MTRWLISVPVWGERYVDEFCATTLPALDRAIVALGQRQKVDARMIIHTDQPERIGGASGSVIEFRPVPAGMREFDCMSQGHRDVLALGLRGDVVVLLTAGSVISEQGLVYCAEVLDDPTIRVVLCAVPRVLASGVFPDTADAQALMSWAWEHRHPMTEECVWPCGLSVDLSRTFFVSEDAVVTRQALPHPLAVRIDGRVLRFTPTVDANLMHCFTTTEMHVALDCAALAVLKLSPADKGFDRAASTMSERAVAGKLVIGDAHQRWCINHQVFLWGGAASCGDDKFMASIKWR